jgi:hypothetical protein
MLKPESEIDGSSMGVAGTNCSPAVFAYKSDEFIVEEFMLKSDLLRLGL